MALVALTPQEIGLRIRWLRIQAGWTEAAHLARQMGESDEGIFTKLEKGKSQSPQRLFSIAVHCVGRQNVIDDLDVVIGFLNGTKGEDDVWVARESNPEPTD